MGDKSVDTGFIILEIKLSCASVSMFPIKYQGSKFNTTKLEKAWKVMFHLGANKRRTHVSNDLKLREDITSLLPRRVEDVAWPSKMHVPVEGDDPGGA